MLKSVFENPITSCDQLKRFCLQSARLSEIARTSKRRSNEEKILDLMSLQIMTTLLRETLRTHISQSRVYSKMASLSCLKYDTKNFCVKFV